MARREESVDTELLAQMESGSGDRIRVPLPKRKVNEMFAIADQILGGRRVRPYARTARPDYPGFQER